MDFDQLEIFLEVARLSSFSRAAEKRYRTQPAISSQIRALEEEVGARLLDRSGGRVSLTMAGKLFFKYAEETLERRKNIRAARRRNCNTSAAIPQKSPVARRGWNCCVIGRPGHSPPSSF